MTAPQHGYIRPVQAQPSSLARCVGDPEKFATESWAHSPVVRRGSGSFDDLLDIEVVERLLTAPARRPMVRLVRDGSPVPPTEYSAAVRLGGVVVDDVVDVPRVMQLVAGGATIVLQSLQHSWPPITRFCNDLQYEIGHVVQANCYLTPPGSTALARHRDAHEVFVLQISGSKVWTIEHTGEVVLQPGDVMYLPRGTWHEAAAHDQLSLHLTIGVLAATPRTALRRAIDRLPAGDLDRALPLDFALRGDRSALARAQLACALDHVAKELDVDAAIDQEIERISSMQRVVPAGHLRSVLRGRPIDDSTWIQMDPRLATRVQGNQLVLRVGGREVWVPGHVSSAIAALGCATPVVVGSLPDLDANSRVVLARRLVLESLAYVVAPSPARDPSDVCDGSEVGRPSHDQPQ